MGEGLFIEGVMIQEDTRRLFSRPEVWVLNCF